MTASRRIAIALLLLAATAGLCVVEAGTAAERWPYPTDEDLVTDAEAAVGQQVFVTGTVPEVAGDGDGTTTHVRIEDAGRERTLAVSGATVAVDPGGTIQVLGTLSATDTIEAERVVIVNSTANAKLQKWGLSLVAVGLFVVLFARHWRVDVRRLRVEERTDG